MYKRYRGGWKRKPRRRPWYFYAALVVGILVGLELLSRLVGSVMGLDQVLTSQPSEQALRIQAYQLGFHSPSGKPYSGLNQGELQAMRSPLLGYQLSPNQQSDYWTINAQGFRDDQPLSPTKSPNEMRIFVLGGAMAFGQLSSDNQATLGNQLEAQLNQQVKAQQAEPNRFQPATLPYTADEVAKVLQRPARIPERQYRVVNAAVPGYTSGNDLAMLIQQISTFNPDLVVLLNSYEDLLLPSTYSGSDVPGLETLLLGDQRQTNPSVGATLQSWFNQIYLVKLVQHYLFQSPTESNADAIALNLTPAEGQSNLAQLLPADNAELTARVDRYRNHLLQMVRWSSATKKPLLVGIQPELTSRSKDQMPPQEQAILAQLGENYTQRIKAGSDKLVAAAKQVAQSNSNTRLLDLRGLYADSKDPVFQSPTSLTDEGYKVLADQFYQTLVRQMAIQPKPYGS
jgi:hypothetical protein